MKYLITFTIIFFLASCNCNFDKKENKTIVNDMLVEFLKAIEDNDYDALDRLTHDDFVFYENGMVWDLERLNTELDNFNNVDVSYEIKHIHSIVDMNVAHLQFETNGKFVYPDTTIMLEFIDGATFVRDNENWYIQFYTSTHMIKTKE